MSKQIDRPGKIVERKAWDAECALCSVVYTDCGTYQEASIMLTEHLDNFHPGWDVSESQTSNSD